MPRLPWPLPAPLVWATAWGVYTLVAPLGLVPVAALLLACALGVAGGFPLLLAASGVVTLALAYWLLPLGLLLLIYPWRDAPLFPRRAMACGAWASERRCHRARGCWGQAAAWAMG
jgi:hypothetical protein